MLLQLCFSFDLGKSCLFLHIWCLIVNRKHSVKLWLWLIEVLRGRHHLFADWLLIYRKMLRDIWWLIVIKCWPVKKLTIVWNQIFMSKYYSLGSGNSNDQWFAGTLLSWQLPCCLLTVVKFKFVTLSRDTSNNNSDSALVP